MSVRIHKAGLQKFFHLCTFFVGKTGIADIVFGVFNINKITRHIHIAADKHRFPGVQFTDITAESIFPCYTVRQTCQITLGVGHIYVYKVKLIVFRTNNAPFLIVFFNAHIVSYADWFRFAENCRAGITFFLGAVPVFKITGKLKIGLLTLHLGFLHAENIGVNAVHKIFKALIHAGS